MIEMHDIEKYHQTGSLKTYVLRHVHLKVEKGEFVSIMGPSGAGKSTLLHIMGMLDEPTASTIRARCTRRCSTVGLRTQCSKTCRCRALSSIFGATRICSTYSLASNGEPSWEGKGHEEGDPWSKLIKGPNLAKQH